MAAAPSDKPDDSGAVAPPAIARPEVILLAVTGMSPAILTETIWALANPTDGDEPVIPDRILVITTTQGRKKILRLFRPSCQLRGVTPWDALRTALEKQGHRVEHRLRFGKNPDDIRVITAADQNTGLSMELSDIRNRQDNAAAADFLLEQVRAIVENPDTQLIVSIAGGRKTMSALLYACMTLLGRETDRLTHVLVSEPFDVLQDFWFPGQPGGPICLGTRHLIFGQRIRELEGSAINPADAVVDLADVPFVPLRNLFQRELGNKPGSFLRLVETCRADIRRRAAENLRLSLDTARAVLDVNGCTVQLTPAEMLLMWFLARRAQNHAPPYAAYKDALDELNAFRNEQLQAANARNFDDWRYGLSATAQCDDRFIVRTLSELRKKLRQTGRDAALLTACLPEKGRCALAIPASMISIK
jgi:CRISPR-associated protein (TIGR02584 family)